MQPSFFRWWAAIGIGLGMVASGAVAQDACVPESPEPDELQLTPAPGAPAAVTLDSPLIARFAGELDVGEYEPGALLALNRVADDGTEAPVPGRYEQFAAQPNVLVFRPLSPFWADTTYTASIFDPREAVERELAFQTGTREDEVPPRFAADEQLRLKASSRATSCAGTRVDVAFTPALDDGPRGSVEHLVYQTRGARLPAPVLRSRVRANMGTEVSTSFLLDPTQADAPLCVVVLAVDGTGRVSDALGPSCFAPDGSARFVGLCSGTLAPLPGVDGALWGLLGVALWLAARRLAAHG